MPTPGQLILLAVAIAVLTIGGVASLGRARGERRILPLLARTGLVGGILACLGLLVWRIISNHQWVPLGDNFDALISLAILLAVFVLYVQRSGRLGGLDWFVMPVVELLLIVALLLGRREYKPYSSLVRGTWLWVHYATAFLGAAAFAIAAAAGAMYVLTSRKLRSKELVGPQFGSLERLEHLTMDVRGPGLRAFDGRSPDRGGADALGEQDDLALENRLGDGGLARLCGRAPRPNPPQLSRAQSRRPEHLRVSPDDWHGCRGVGDRRHAVRHRLLLLGLNHSTAPLDVRERLAFSVPQRDAAIAAFRQRFPEAEAVLVSTCNRVELYAARAIHAQPRPEQIIEFFSTFHSIPADSFQSHLYQKADQEAVHHLFSVVASLDSMVVGETQILGQVREAYDAAKASAATGSLLNPLFQRALAVGKQVMHETSIGEGRLSIASVAVDYARRIFDRFQDKTVLNIGAGKMATLVLKHFQELRPRSLLICNRDPEKAIALAGRFGGTPAPFEQLSEHLVAADIVVSSTGSSDPIITRKQFEGLLRPRRYRPIFLIDIALPRDIEASVGELENVYLYNIDDLQQVVAQTQVHRRDALDAARALVAKQVEEFFAWARARELGPVIEQLSRRYHRIAQEEVGRTLHKLPNITDVEKGHLEELARRLVNKLLNDPIQTLRKGDATHGATVQYLRAMEKLFRLGDDSNSSDGEEMNEKLDEPSE